MMGSKHEVSVWCVDEFDQGHWKDIYRGEHFATALFAMVFSKEMKIHVHDQVYERVESVAKAQGRTKSDLVQDALVRFLGMEGMPLEDEEIYGRKEDEDNKNAG
jgi:predicted DNA-binding protein